MKYSIRRIITLCFAILIISTLITGCGANQSNGSDSQQVNIFVADDDESTITYSDDYIQSASGFLGQNETKLIEGIEKDIPYEIGCKTNATEGTEIELTFKE